MASNGKGTHNVEREQEHERGVRTVNLFFDNLKLKNSYLSINNLNIYMLEYILLFKIKRIYDVFITSP